MPKNDTHPAKNNHLRVAGQDFSPKQDAQYEQDKLLARMREFNAELDRLMRAQFYSSATPEEFLIEATKTVSQVLAIKRVSVWSFTESRDGIFCDCLFEDIHRPENMGLLLTKQDFPRYFDALSQFRVITADQARTDTRTSEFTESYLTPLNIFSMLDAHIPSAAGVRGVLCCENVGIEREWAMDEASFVASVAELIGLALDRAERQRTQEQLADALRAAEKAGEAKSTFLANMSHEIRTPLNGVLGMLELVLRDEPDQGRRQYLEIAYKSAHSLLNLLGDVLDYSRLEAGELHVVSEPYSLTELIHEVVSLFKSQAEAKGLHIAVSIDPKIPASISGDEARVRQVLANFFSNALKFTNQGQIEVSVTTEQTGSKAHWCLEVKDTGIGMPAAALKALFQRFSQVDASATRQHGGSGLGLAICKQLVEMMGGEIGVRSIEHKGSTFWIRLPLKDTLARANTHAEPLEDEPQINGLVLGRQLKILAAEDNIVNQKVLKAMVHSLEHEITLVNNGQEALEAIAKQHYDVILMDIQMPVMDGITATNAIRELPEPLNNITIIALTANAMPGHPEKYLAAGMNDYLAKPLERSQLALVLERVMQ